MKDKYVALSLGWGVQSFTLAAMAALGEIEKPDVAIHADTTHESILTYRFAERWTGWLEEHGIKVVTVSDEKIASQVWSGKLIPAFTLNERSERGQRLRTCTHRWKIAPMQRWIRANRKGLQVEMWIGISTDEALRMKPSKVKYITNRWPLIERGTSRKDCEAWLTQHGIEVPPKSACTFCPYHDTSEWRRTMNEDHDWREAVAVDNAIRNTKPPYRIYVHPSRYPLESIDLRTLEEMGQMRLWDEECSGICGV